MSQYHHFEKQTKWPKFIYDTMADIQRMKTKSNNQITVEIYNKTIDVAIWMGRINNNETINNNIK